VSFPGLNPESDPDRAQGVHPHEGYSASEPDTSSEALRARVAGLEAQLEDLRAKHLGLLENIQDLIFAVDEHGEPTFVGGNTIGILGISPNEASAMPADRWRDMVHPEDLPRVAESIRRCLERPDSTTFMVRVRDLAGEYRYLDAHLSSTVSPDDEKPVGASGVCRDVTAMVRAQRIMESLNRAAERVQDSGLSPSDVLRAVASQLAELELSVVVMLLDDDGETLRPAESHSVHGEIESVSRMLGDALEGWTLPAAAIEWLSAVMAERRPVCAPVTAELMARCLPEEQRYAAPALARMFAGQQLIAAPMVAGGSPLGLLLVYGPQVGAGVVPSVAAFANQTAIALRNAQLVQTLRDGEEQYRNIFESVTDGVTIFDTDGYILDVNPAACEMYGYSRDELIGMHLSRIVHPDYYHDLVNFRRAVERDGSFSAQALNIRKDGTIIEVEVRGAAFRHKGQLRLISVDTDITERMESHRALLRSEKLRALGQMAGGIAHDFNNLLLGIRGFVNLALLELEESPEQARDDLQRALSSTADAAEAVRRLQSLYRQSDDTSDFTAVHIDQLVREVVALTKPRWKDEQEFRGVTINLITDLGDPAPVMGNASELRRVLTNIILNAVDAMPQGGTLAIRTRSEDGWCVVSISDTGVGMTEEQRAQLFEPFFTTKGTAGSGLGLAVSLRIVERHGGKIEVSSKPYEGSTFTVRLPFAPARKVAEPPAQEAYDAVASAPRPHMHVLAVDDEIAVLTVLTRLLERDGQTVTTATSGQEAIVRLREQPYDLLVTDLGMPNVSGHRVAQVARELYPGMPIVLSTGWGETISPEQLANLGATALLPKPFSYEDLCRALRDATRE